MTSKPNSTGMPSRFPSTASRCRRLISAGSVTNSSDPASPRPRAASTMDGWSDVEAECRPRAPHPSRAGAEVEVLGQLPGLLRRRHSAISSSTRA